MERDHKLQQKSGLHLTLYKPAVKWFFVALIVRLLAGVAIHFYSLSAGYEGFYPLPSGGDDRFYWNSAVSIYEGNIPISLPNIYPYVLAKLFFLTGPSLIAGKFVNILAGALSVYIGVLLVRKIMASTSTSYSRGGLSNPANVAGLFLTFYPSNVFYSTQLLKDPLLGFLAMLGLYFAISLLTKFRFSTVLFFGVSLLGLYLFRPYASIVLTLSFFLYLILLWQIKWWVKLVISVLNLSIAGVVPYILGFGWFGLNYIQKYLDPVFISTIRQNLYSKGGSAAGINLDFSNPFSFLSSFGYSFATAMFGPFPWQLRSAVHLIALPEAIFVWLLIPIWIKGVISLIQRHGKSEQFLLLFSLLLIGAIALFSDNIGANTRLRMLPWSTFLIYAALHVRLRLKL